MENELKEKIDQLKDMLRRLEGVAVAFSGGVDSSLLLKTASDVLGPRCIAVIARTPFMPASEFAEAVAFCHENGITYLSVSPDIMRHEELLANPRNRCYICKNLMFTAIRSEAAKAGFLNVVEASNADDAKAFRPGIKALKELGIISPFTEVGLTKAEIREYLYELGLSVASKPSFSCLATRIPYGDRISRELLAKIERGETIMRDLGFKQYRVRVHDDIARIEVLPDELSNAVSLRNEIFQGLKELGFTYITLDLQGFRSGSMDEGRQ